MTDAIRMSHSSANLINSCERKYFYKKVSQVAPDVEQEQRHFVLGKVFHLALEKCLHRSEEYSEEMLADAAHEEGLDNEQDIAMIHGMILKYLILHRKSELEVAICEIAVGNDKTIGYVDAIMKDDCGFWYICDLKTAGRFDDNLMARLIKDQQLNLYAYFIDQIAEKLDLDIEKFAGCLYRVTTKATIKWNKRETRQEYIERVFERIESYSIFIPKEMLKPKAAYDTIIKAQERATKLKESDETEAKQCFNSCFDYFRPCDFFSQCYGYKHFEGQDKFPVENSYSAKPLKQDELYFLE